MAQLSLPDVPQAGYIGHRIQVGVVNLALFPTGAHHHPGAHTTLVVIGEHAAGRRAFIIRVRTDHEYGHALTSGGIA